jgi:hypothetical protein
MAEDPWAEFRIQPPAASAASAPSTAAPDEWAGFRAPATTWGGLYKSFDAGVAEGVAGIRALPNTIGSLGAAGIDKLGKGVSDYFGLDYKRPSSDNPPLRGMFPNYDEALKSIRDTAYGGKALYESKTLGERTMRKASEMGVGALGGPGGPIGNVIRYGVLPGVASEVVGDTPGIKGTSYEAPVKVGMAIATGGAAAATARNSTAQAIRNSLPPGVSPQMVDQAQTLMTEAQTMGVSLTWPEALSQVAGRPVLSDTIRHLEAAGPTQGRMSDFYGPRPQQVELAARAQFDNIAPVNNAPSTIGHQAGEVIEGAVRDAKGSINTAARPHYSAAESVMLTPAEMAQVRAIPGYRRAAAEVRNNEQLNRYVAHLPEESVGFLNEVKKRLDWQGNQAAAPIGPQGIPNQQIAGGLKNDAAAARQTGINATGGPTGPYATALGIEEHGYRALDRVLQGPIGKMATKDTTTRQAIEALFPRNPLANSADEVATAVNALASRSPRVATDLVRAHAEEVFNEAQRSLRGSMASQAAGGKFSVQLVGNPQQRANLQAAVEALPNGADRWAGFNRFLEVLEATGTRQNIGSKTAYNAEFLKETGASNIIGEVAKGAANPVSRFTQGLVERYERWNLGRNLDELATILTNPAAVNQLRAIARMPANSPQAANIAWRLTNMTQASGSPPVNKP